MGDIRADGAVRWKNGRPPCATGYEHEHKSYARPFVLTLIYVALYNAITTLALDGYSNFSMGYDVLVCLVLNIFISFLGPSRSLGHELMVDGSGGRF